MKYILSHPKLTKSAKLLANKIGEIIGEEIIVRTTPNNLNNECIIRYGNSTSSNEILTNYNSKEMIRLVGNKERLSNFLAEDDANPEKISNLTIYNRNMVQPDEFPIVVRTELNKGGGIGIVVCENQEQFEPYLGNRWTHWYNFQFELGIHILGGEIVKVFKKIRTGGLGEEKYPIRNTQRGYDFKLRKNWKERYKGLERFVKQLYELVPIQFARLDIGYDIKTGGYRLIEINSAPDLSQNVFTLNMYAKFLAGKIGE